MKKAITAVFLFFSIYCTAQLPQVKYSLPFEEPDGLNAKTFQCNNGHTLLLNFSVHDGIEVDVYDSSHKKIRHTAITGSLWDKDEMKNSTIEGIFNIGGNVALFLSQTKDGKPSLFRILLSAQTGLSMGQSKVADLPKYTMIEKIRVEDRVNPAKGFFVVKDENSDAYAVAINDDFDNAPGKGLKVIHFDGSHKEISSAYYDDPSVQPYMASYLGMIVNGTEEVLLFTYAALSKEAETAGTNIKMSSFKAGTFTDQAFVINEPLPNSRAIVQYNSVKDLIELMVLSRSMQKGTTVYYTTVMLAIDPKDKRLSYVKGLDTKPAQTYGKAHYKAQAEEDYMPMNMSVNPDGSLSVVTEQLAYVDRFSYLGEIGVVDYDASGNSSSGFLIQKRHISKTPIRMLSHDEDRIGKVNIYKGEDFRSNDNPYYYSCRYFNSPSGRFVIYNDHPENFDLAAEKYPAALGGVKASNTACVSLGSTLSKTYLFGKPDNSFENRYAALMSGSYSNTTGDYSVIIMEESGRKRQARIAWVHF